MEIQTAARAARGPASLVQEAGDLASLPEVAARVIGLVDRPQTTAAQLADVISRDPNLTVRLLRVANSSCYSHRGSVDTVARAVAVLGMRQVRDMTLGISAMRSFEGLPVGVVSMEGFWLHSLHVAVIARLLAEEREPAIADAVFVGGLLHDVGELVMCMCLPDAELEVLWLTLEGGSDLSQHAAERQLIGFDHAEVGACLARRWNLPPLLHDCIAFHHQPAQAAMAQARAVSIVHVANSIAYATETGMDDLSGAPPLDAAAARLIGFEETQMIRLIEPALAGVAEARSTFGI